MGQTDIPWAKYKLTPGGLFLKMNEGDLIDIMKQKNVE